MSHERFTAAALLAAILSISGCGESRNSATVSGRVTIGGQPMADIIVTFEPLTEGAGLGSTGRTDASGRFTLSFVDNGAPGAMVGMHQVTFSDWQTADREVPDAGDLPPQKTRIPEQYLIQKLNFEVKPGDNPAANFDL